MNDGKHNHRWSGWPGAHCLKCGSDDYMELAIGNDWYDAFTEKWDIEEHQEEYEKYKHCKVSEQEWYDHLVATKAKTELESFYPDGRPGE